MFTYATIYNIFFYNFEDNVGTVINTSFEVPALHVYLIVKQNNEKYCG